MENNVIVAINVSAPGTVILGPVSKWRKFLPSNKMLRKRLVRNSSKAHDWRRDDDLPREYDVYDRELWLTEHAELEAFLRPRFDFRYFAE
mmetsp:Transcript_5524/g.8356  ORF Transcript_5524/g.8356 Transcript_5524/m.8356 type:complete len:90 (+) Transcript_5524:401-670(+)